MKVIILTTNTDHHKYFINKICTSDDNLSVFFETKKPVFKYKTAHKFYKLRDKFEKKVFQNQKYKRNIKYFNYISVNDHSVKKNIYKIKPDIIVAFGISILKKKILKSFNHIDFVNFHGGDPELYRGLDSHFWGLYHKDFNNLYTTMHYIDLGIDTGDIISKKKIKISELTNIYDLRIKNTIFCIKMFNSFYRKKINNEKIKKFKQKNKGRYYSALPSQLVNTCLQNFINLKNNL